jgi:capsular exopolysaccharide synthesis family protein
MQDQQRIGVILWRGKWLILLSLVLSVGLAVFITRKATRVYQATAIIQVTSPSTPQPGGNSLQDLQANQTLATTYATLLTDRSFLSRIRPVVAHGNYSVSELQDLIDAQAVNDTALIKLSVQETSPAVAQSLAADVARAFLNFVRNTSTSRTSDQAHELDAQISALSAQIRKLSASNDAGDKERLKSLQLARAALTQQLASVWSNGIAQGGSVSLTASPSASKAPVKPRPLLNYAVGVMIGLLSGVVLAWLRVRMDRGLHSTEEAEELLEAPVLATIPIRKRPSIDDAVLTEAYDVLRANLAFLSLDQSLQVITFTSYNPGEGKTSSVEGLAWAAVRGGLDVLLIDGDTRTASLTSKLGARGMPGFTNVIVGTVPLEHAVLEVAPGLSLLPSGPTPPNPPSLLSSGRTRELMVHLRQRHGLVIVDSPPVAHLADASILAAVSDGVVVVGRVGLTNRSDLVTAVANLRHSPTPIVGSILLRQQEIDESYYPLSTDARPYETGPYEQEEARY